MADTEESPAQRQARIRREKREAKIKSGGTERLDKITRLSGRTPESLRNESPIATPPQMSSPAITPAAQTPSTSTPTPRSAPDAEQRKIQEDYIRALLQGSPGQQQQQQQGQQQNQQQVPGVDQDDPMLKMLNNMLSGISDDPNAGGLPSLNPDDIAKATGLPSFVTNMVMGKKEEPLSPAQQKEATTWKILHMLFAFFAGIYLLFIVDKMTGTFGKNPPAPATFQNPLSVFCLGEALLHGSRAVLATTPRKTGPGFWLQTVKDVFRDASVMVFMLGFHTWATGRS